MKAKVVGAGIFGCACARILAEAGYGVSVVDERERIGGNCSTYDDGGIEVHRYGSHIFHTDSEEVWQFVNRFCRFNSYRHQVLACHAGRKYFMPFNLSLVNQFFGKDLSPAEAVDFLESLQIRCQCPANLEEQAVSLVGRDLYEAFVKNYTAKQWHADSKSLDPSIIRRLPVRATYDVSYFSDRHQGIPICGYQEMFDRMLEHPSISVSLGVRYSEEDAVRDVRRGVVVYTGALDELFGYRLGTLSWRSLRFETETVQTDDFQGTAVVNYVDTEPAYTRIHEFRHYHPELSYEPGRTVIQREYPEDWKPGREKYYPVNNAATASIQAAYLNLASGMGNFYVGGRLGLYRYMDMDDTVAAAMDLCRGIIGK